MKFLLKNPALFRLFNIIIGADYSRKLLTKQYIMPLEGERVLDIGCGISEILRFFPQVEYHGFDISTEYVNKANKIHCKNANYYNKEFSAEDAPKIGKFDIVLCLGLLHHIPDDEAISLMNLIYDILKPQGRLITIDGCFVNGQNRIAKYIIRNDRGKFVRTEEGYAKLFRSVFNSFQADIRQDLLNIPYTHIIHQYRKS